MGCRLFIVRSANRDNACNTWNVNSSGNVNNNNASNANTFEPDCKVKGINDIYIVDFRLITKSKEPNSLPKG